MSAEWLRDVIIAERLGWQRGYDTKIVESDNAPDCEDWFQPFKSFDVSIESPGGEKQYLYYTQDLTKPPLECEWGWQRTSVLPHYQSDENDAGLILDHIASLGWMVTVYTGEPHLGHDGPVNRCCIMRGTQDFVLGGVDVIAETRPLAICEAFVQAMERWGNG